MNKTFTNGILVGGAIGLVLGCFAGCSIGAGGSAGSTKRETAPPAVEPPTRTSAEPAAPDPSPQPPEPAPPAEPPPPPSDWNVTERTEEMSDETIRQACTRSSNQIQLDFPYGARSGNLCIRQHPRFGQDVIISLSGSGQILCRSYQSCTIRVRFDDGEVQSFSAVGPSDNSTESVFVTNDARFIASARRASRIRVQLEFFQNGVQTFDFPARGLEW